MSVALRPEAHEQRADDELGRRHVLAGEEAGEVRPGLELVLRDRRPLELVEAVEPLDRFGRGLR